MKFPTAASSAHPGDHEQASASSQSQSSSHHQAQAAFLNQQSSLESAKMDPPNPPQVQQHSSSLTSQAGNFFRRVTLTNSGPSPTISVTPSSETVPLIAVSASPGTTTTTSAAPNADKTLVVSLFARFIAASILRSDCFYDSFALIRLKPNRSRARERRQWRRLLNCRLSNRCPPWPPQPA